MQCPGILSNYGAPNDRCADTAYALPVDATERQDILIILQPAVNQPMTLWWTYKPDPQRHTDTCDLAKNGVCNVASGKCLEGTDCTDCGGVNCEDTRCFSVYPHSAQLGVPPTCDDPNWASLEGNIYGGRVAKMGM
jgi:hypothetical protein